MSQPWQMGVYNATLDRLLDHIDVLVYTDLWKLFDQLLGRQLDSMPQEDVDKTFMALFLTACVFIVVAVLTIQHAACSIITFPARVVSGVIALGCIAVKFGSSL